ncbi:MAG TPA: hypothetical protein DDW34_05190 [Clostridium sp.]|nr:hypothetical protein [Clostridium sp.]
MSDIEKAIETLRKISDIETSKRYRELHEIKNFNYDLLTAIEALQEKLERENPKPLMLEELRCMDCEPVYIVRGLHLPCENDEWWAIIHTFQNCEFAHFISHGKKFSADFEDYGVRWLAYRYKPKHIGEATNIVEGE